MDFVFKLRVLRWLIADAISQWRKEVWPAELDASYCCDGRECGCQAATHREIWTWNTGRK